MIRRSLFLAGTACLAYLLWLPWIPALRHHNPRDSAYMRMRVSQARDKGERLRIHHQWKPLSEISPDLLHAVLLSEDDQFYQHHGFDMEQILVAVETDWQKRRLAYGGSTITQQLARTLYLSPSKNFLRKGKEALITLWLEEALTKRRIMELYLNEVEWGPGVFGAEAAAQYYFQKPAADLVPDEAVALASILPSPRRWNPHSERAFMAQRRTQLLERMEKAGYRVDVSTPS